VGPTRRQTPLAQSAALVQISKSPEAHVDAHDVFSVPPSAGCPQQTSPAAQLSGPEQVSASPMQALALVHDIRPPRVAMQQTSVAGSQGVRPHAILSAPPSVRLPESVALPESVTLPESVPFASRSVEASLVPDEPEAPEELLPDAPTEPEEPIEPDELEPLEPVPDDPVPDEESDVSPESVSTVPEELDPLPPTLLPEDPLHPSATVSPSATDPVETFFKRDIVATSYCRPLPASRLFSVSGSGGAGNDARDLYQHSRAADHVLCGPGSM
jgi:hypothetical protein